MCSYARTVCWFCRFFFIRLKFVRSLHLCNLCFPSWADDSHILSEIITVEVIHTHHPVCVVNDVHGCNVVHLIFSTFVENTFFLFAIYEMKVCACECVRLRIWKHQKFKGIFVPFPHIPRSSCLFYLDGFLGALYNALFLILLSFRSVTCSRFTRFFFHLFGKYTQHYFIA